MPENADEQPPPRKPWGYNNQAGRRQQQQQQQRGASPAATTSAPHTRSGAGGRSASRSGSGGPATRRLSVAAAQQQPSRRSTSPAASTRSSAARNAATVPIRRGGGGSSFVVAPSPTRNNGNGFPEEASDRKRRLEALFRTSAPLMCADADTDDASLAFSEPPALGLDGICELPVKSTPPPIPGASKALYVSVSYAGRGGAWELSVDERMYDLQACLQRSGFGPAERRVLVDSSGTPPTRAGILDAVAWLVDDAQPGDSLLFTFVGRGGVHSSESATHSLAPTDCDTAGLITSVELHQALVAPLPAGVKLTCFFDIDKGGTPLVLPRAVRIAHGVLQDVQSPYGPATVPAASAQVSMLSSAPHDSEVPAGVLLRAAAETVAQAGAPEMTVARLLHCMADAAPGASFQFGTNARETVLVDHVFCLGVLPAQRGYPAAPCGYAEELMSAQPQPQQQSLPLPALPPPSYSLPEPTGPAIAPASSAPAPAGWLHSPPKQQQAPPPPQQQQPQQQHQQPAPQEPVRDESYAPFPAAQTTASYAASDLPNISSILPLPSASASASAAAAASQRPAETSSFACGGGFLSGGGARQVLGAGKALVVAANATFVTRFLSRQGFAAETRAASPERVTEADVLWLVDDTQPGDSLFLSMEWDGDAGFLHACYSILSAHMPRGSRLTWVVERAHGAPHLLPMPHRVACAPDGQIAQVEGASAQKGMVVGVSGGDGVTAAYVAAMNRNPESTVLQLAQAMRAVHDSYGDEGDQDDLGLQLSCSRRWTLATPLCLGILPAGGAGGGGTDSLPPTPRASASSAAFPRRPSAAVPAGGGAGAGSLAGLAAAALLPAAGALPAPPCAEPTFTPPTPAPAATDAAEYHASPPRQQQQRSPATNDPVYATDASGYPVPMRRSSEPADPPAAPDGAAGVSPLENLDGATLDSLKDVLLEALRTQSTPAAPRPATPPAALVPAVRAEGDAPLAPVPQQQLPASSAQWAPPPPPPQAAVAPAAPAPEEAASPQQCQAWLQTFCESFCPELSSEVPHILDQSHGREAAAMDAVAAEAGVPGYFVARRRVEEYYRAVNPSKLHQVEHILSEYLNSWDDLYTDLAERYERPFPHTAGPPQQQYQPQQQQQHLPQHMPAPQPQQQQQQQAPVQPSPPLPAPQQALFLQDDVTSAKTFAAGLSPRPLAAADPFAAPAPAPAAQPKASAEDKQRRSSAEERYQALKEDTDSFRKRVEAIRDARSSSQPQREEVATAPELQQPWAHWVSSPLQQRLM